MNQEQAILTLCENIGVFSERMKGAEQQRSICVRQLARQLKQSSEAVAPEELYQKLRSILAELSPCDLASVCLDLFPRSTQKDYLPSMDAFFPSSDFAVAGSHGRVALVRNRLNEEAYGIFSQAIPAAKAYYLPSFSDACEDVFDNRCEFGILPIENTADGRLFGFYAMLDRYELKICGACRLEPDQTEGAVRYALIGKTIPSRIPKSATWFFECSVVTEIGAFPKDIMDVAPFFDASITKVDTLPVLYDDGLQRVFFTFRISKEKAEAFHFYLTMEHTRYSFIGLYPILT